MKIKVEDKDFYEAYHILSRATNIDVNREVLEEWRMFLEGTLLMMKKKYQEGIAMMKLLLGLPLYAGSYESVGSSKGRERYAFIKPLIFLYKAFGELSQGNVAVAKEDYRLYESICERMEIPYDNLSKNYNSLII